MSPLRRLAGAYADAFSGLPRAVWILAAATLVNRAGTMVLPFFTLYLTRSLGWSIGEAGRLLSLYGLGAIAGSWLGGVLADRYRPVRVQQISLLGTGVGFLALAGIEQRWLLAPAVLLLSVVAELYRPALLATASRSVAPPVRTRALGLLRLSVNAGMSIGPAIGGLLAAANYRLLFVVDAATCWAAAAVLALALDAGREERPHERTEAPPGRSPWRDGPFLLFLAATVALTVIFFQINATFPLYLRDHYGLGEAVIGGLLGFNALLVVACEMLVLRRLEGRAPLPVIGLGAFLVALGFALLPFGRGWLYAAATVGVWTIGEMLTLPLANSVVANRAGAGLTGRYVGAYTVAFSVGFLLAPAIGTAVYERFGALAWWLGVGAAGAVVGVAFAALGRVLASPPT